MTDIRRCELSGKVCMTLPVAKATAKRMRRRTPGSHVGHYHCACEWWHVGSSVYRHRRRR